MKTINTEITSNIDDILTSLHLLKTPLTSNNIQHKLYNLHTTFTKLVHILKKPKPTPFHFELIDTSDNGIQTYKYNNITVSMYKDRIIKVKTGFSYLDTLCIKMGSVREVEEMVAMHYESLCDKCGKYWCRKDDELAGVRQQESDFVSVYHKRCVNE